MNNKLCNFIIALILFSQTAYSQQNNPLKNILNQNSDLFGTILSKPQKNEIQVLYTQINRDKKNNAHFKTYSYNLDNQHYFYPASTIKLPVAIFALEKLNELGIESLNKYTPLKIDSAFKDQSRVDNDYSAKNGKASIAHYIKKILLVSDNDAFNRLYEFTDRETINEKLSNYGFKHSRIVNRLAVADGEETSRHTNPFYFYKGNEVIYTKPGNYDPNTYPLKLKNLTRGKGYLDNNNQLIREPFDFTGKNTFQLSDQHELMKRLFFPAAFPKNKRFNLTDSDYDFLYTYMSRYPTESTAPKYNLPIYYPTYCKFLFYGANKDLTPNPNIRIFNKVGDAYGYAIDNIYFIDYENKVEFILTAVIQSNNNQIYNDNIYEYETVCLPFLKNLGQKIYDLELVRPKKYKANVNKYLRYK